MSRSLVLACAGILCTVILALTACGRCSDDPDCRATDQARSKTEEFKTVQAVTWAAGTLDVPATFDPKFLTRTITPTGTPTPTSSRTPTKKPSPTGSVSAAPSVAGSGVSCATASTASIALEMGPGRDGNQVALANLTAQGDKTDVRVSIKPNGPNETHPVSIQEGTCPTGGAVKYPLENSVNGSSTTVIDTSLSSLLTGSLAIMVEESPKQPDRYIACSQIPKGVIVNLGPGRDADRTPATAALLTIGNQTQVNIRMAPNQDRLEQPAAIYTGTCANLGSAEYPLRNLSFGFSQSNVKASLADLLKGGFAVNVGKSTTEPDVYVACADLK